MLLGRLLTAEHDEQVRHHRGLSLLVKLDDPFLLESLPQDQPKVKRKKELPDPFGVLDEVTTFVELAKDGAYMAGDRRVHHTERSKWRYTFRRLAADALAALTASDPAPAQEAVTKIVDLACDMKRWTTRSLPPPPCCQISLRADLGADP